MTDDRVETGLEARRAVLGDDHVENTRAALTDFDQDFDDMLCAWPWGSI